MNKFKYIFISSVMAFAMSGIAPLVAQAAWPVTIVADIPQQVKELGLDTAVNVAVNIAVAGIAKSITKWAATGFEGKPAFSQNILQEALKLEGDVIEKGLNNIKINNVKLGGFLCGPFSQEIQNALRVQIALQKSQDTTQHSKCTVSKILGEGKLAYEDFVGDFNKGGWPAWLEITQNPANNRIGAYITIQEGIWNQQSEETDKKDKELSFGQGILSQKKKGECKKQIGEYEAEANEELAREDLTEEERGVILQNIIDLQGQAAADEGCLPGERGPEQVITPGQTISNTLAKGLGLPQDRLAVADEIDEMIGALAQGLMLKLLKETGIVGAGTAPAGGRSALDELDEETRTMEEERMNRSREAIEGATEYARREAELNEQIRLLQADYDLCLAQLSAIGGTVTVNEDSDGTVNITTDDNSILISIKTALCEEIKAKLTEAEKALTELAIAQIEATVVVAGTDPFSCRYLFDSRPAARPVDFYAEGPYAGTSGTGVRSGTKLTIEGDGNGFYKNYVVNFDLKAGDMPVENGSIKIINFTPGDAKNYYNGAELGITSKASGGLGKARYDNNAYLGGPNYYQRSTSWTPNSNYNITISYDAQTSTLSTLIFNKNQRKVVGSFDIKGALAGQDIACTVEQCHLTLVGLPGWSFSNISVKMEPGGPFGSGMPGRCGL